MFQAKLYYTVENGGDGSAMVRFYADQECADIAYQTIALGAEDFCENEVRTAVLNFDDAGTLLNPSRTKEELLEEYAEQNDDEDASDRLPAQEKPSCVKTAKGFHAHIYYVITNGGDGSVGIDFYGSQEVADLAGELDCEPLNDNVIGETLKFNAKGTLLNPAATKEELLKDLEEKKQELEESAEADDEASALSQKFKQWAQAGAQSGLKGKKVCFIGKFSSMTKEEAQQRAQFLDAQVSGYIGNDTDFVIAGKGAGAKLQRAVDLNIPILNEKQWLEKIGNGGIQPPKFRGYKPS